MSFILSRSCVHLTSGFMFFFFNDTATTEIYTLSLHDALPISDGGAAHGFSWPSAAWPGRRRPIASASQNTRVARSEEHTSELQSPCNLVCRLLLEKKKNCQTRVLALVLKL